MEFIQLYSFEKKLWLQYFIGFLELVASKVTSVGAVHKLRNAMEVGGCLAKALLCQNQVL